MKRTASCEICGLPFANISEVKRHVLTRHKRYHDGRNNDYANETLEDLLDGRDVKSRVIKQYTTSVSSLASETNPLVFDVAPTDDQFIDMSSVYVKVKLNVTHSDGSPLTEEDENKIAPCNDFFDALFSEIRIKFGEQAGKELEIGQGSLRPQIGMLNKLLNHDDRFLEEALSGSIIWQKDAPQTLDYHRWRHNHIALSKDLILYGQLFTGFYEFKSLLLPQMRMTVELKTNPAQFGLIRAKDADATYKLNNMTCCVELQWVKLITPLAEEIENRIQLKGEIMTYPYQKMKTTFSQIPAGSTLYTQFPIHVSGLEKEGFLMFLDAAANNSKERWENNPMIFPASKYKVNYLEFFADYHPILYKPFEPDFAKGNYSECYKDLLRIRNTLKTGQMNMAISHREFGELYGIFGIDFVPESGTMRVNIEFEEPTPCAIWAAFVGLEKDYITFSRDNFGGLI